MPATAPPTLGYGQRAEAPIDAVNQWMRSQPWYQQLLASFGQTPNNVHLNDAQKQQVIRAAQANGVVVDEGHDGQQVDDSGNFEAKGHGLRNTLIVAGIAAAALATAGAAGVFAGGAGAGAEAGAGAAALGPSTAANMAATAGIVGGNSIPAALLAGGGSTVGGAASAVPWGSIISSGASLFGNLFAAHEQSATADRAAEISAAAAKYSADLQAKATADALKFQYAGAENAFQNNEVSRKGNYDIFAARERRLGSIGDEVGLGPREIPAYVPGVDPGFSSVGDAASGAGGGAGAAPSSGNPTDANAILAALTDNYKKLGVTPTGPGSGATDIAYFAQKMASTGGLSPDSAGYWLGPNGRIAQELAKAGHGGAAAPTTSAPGAPPPLGTTATPFMPPTLAAGVPQSIGYYA